MTGFYVLQVAHINPAKFMQKAELRYSFMNFIDTQAFILYNKLNN